MIFTILMIIVLIGSIFIFIEGLKAHEDSLWTLGIFVFVLFSAMLLLGLNAGESIYKQDLKRINARKESIVLTLENSPSTFIIKEAEDYNRDIEHGNNYFFRFNIEDRSEFLIDIDSYLRKLYDEE